ncbi:MULTISPECIES: GNAT family N-acetyltransferase [Cryobacterium]|uniref:N-acetyltransferase n=1 Tax=Cryobacterium breve TaxID=1259258 RepID=A0ABY2J2Z0_9MICO|nr:MULTISPECIES: GNAT family N-acetyltransferase [Cryobacterium]TFC90895.1 N-acetyltransferase [Cryobacterium sp. TmT3-12]TFC99214.1 N-acetyltransferase [Cryobacterium breve]
MSLEIRTDRLLLRRWRESDLAPFAAMGEDPEVMRYFPAPLTRAEGDALAARADGLFDTHGYGLWALETRSTGDFLGFAGLAPLPAFIPGPSGIEVGWRLARAFWGQGYATEAARAALGFAFGRLELEQVHAITAVINEPSRAVMERLGMTAMVEFQHPKIPVGSSLRVHIRYSVSRAATARASAAGDLTR